MQTTSLQAPFKPNVVWFIKPLVLLGPLAGAGRRKKPLPPGRLQEL